MYNLDRYIADFLVNNKSFSAQGIGEFAIVDGQAANGAPLIEFRPNKQADTSEELIKFVSEQEGKNKIVTGFDLESHFNQIKQFINIGTPWIIPGIGQVQFGRNRELEFVQTEQSEHNLHERIKRKQAANEANYNTYEANNPVTQRPGNTGTVILTLFIILALGAGGYYFYSHKSKIEPAATATTDTSATVTDTVVSVPSSSNMNSTATAVKPPVVNKPAVSESNNSSAVTSTTPESAGTSGYRFVLNQTMNPVYALKRFNQLKTYGKKVYIDSAKHDTYSVYKIYLIKAVPPSDTARVRDSLTTYFGKPVKIETTP